MRKAKQKIINALKNVYDPEIPVNIWDLGLVYSITINPDNIVVQMTFTSPACPVINELLLQVKEAVKSVSSKEVFVKVVWDPPWNLSKMSESAKMQLDLTDQDW